MSKNKYKNKTLYVVLDWGDYIDCFSNYAAAENKCNELEDIYDNGGTSILEIPFNDILRIIKK